MAGRNVNRGEVYLADFESLGGRLKKRRPAVVVQNDVGNRVSRETIMVGVRDADRGKRLPIRVFVPAGVGGLRKDSDIDLGQIHTIHKDDLGTRIGRMPGEVMAAVDTALKKSLALR